MLPKYTQFLRDKTVLEMQHVLGIGNGSPQGQWDFVPLVCERFLWRFFLPLWEKFSM